MVNIFSWMFKFENFKDHVKNLFLQGMIMYLIGGLIFGAGVMFSKGIPSMALNIIGILFFICPSLLMQGYYWCLTENIIDRRTDVAASSVYDGKVKTIEKFDLPEYDLLKFVWRGVASTVAVLILAVPFAALIALVGFGGMAIDNFLGSGGMVTPVSFIGIGILFIFLAPALLWNYAKRDSVIAVLNFRQAIYIIGNYPFRYIKNIVIMLLVSIAVSMITAIFNSMLEVVFGKGITTIIVGLVVLFFINLYSVFVISYLHGTITPPGEGV